MSFEVRDFIETREGLIFAVVAAGEEEGRIACFLRYVRCGGGCKKLATSAANALLHAAYPRYLWYSRRRDAHLHGVAIEDVRKHHRPRDRARELLRAGAERDALETKGRALLELFRARGVSENHVGVTGSVLIGAQNERSDIDLVVYGRRQFQRARRMLRAMIAAGTLDGLDTDAWLAAYRRRGCELLFDEFLWHERRKYTKGLIAGTKFDIGLIAGAHRTEALRYQKLGAIRVRARVVDDRGAFDHPARYRIDHRSLSEALSYTPTYAGQARAGEIIEVSGLQERAEDGGRRVVVGSDREARGQYIKVVRCLAPRG